MLSPYDVVVVGSGPAGATAARYAARRGLKVLLVDKRKEIGVPVQCGEYVAHNEEVRAIFPTVTDLEELMGVPYRVREVDTPIIRIWSPNGRRYDIPFKGFTVQRDKMDQGIAAQAVQEGAELMTETTVVGVRGDEVKTNHGTFHGKVVVGSDGPRSTVAQSVGLEWPVSAPAMSATAVGDFGDATDMFFGNLAPGGYAWIIPKAGCANVGLGTWERFRGNLRDLFDKFVTNRRLVPGKATGGFVPVLGPPPRTVKDNVMLVGDAAGMVMATNGGGNNVAMIAGRIAGLTAADHLLDGTPLDAYETRRRRRAIGPGCADQEARGPILRERPAPRGGDGPHRTTSDGARDPMSAPPAPVRGEGLIDAGGIDGGTDGFPVSRRRLGGRPPGDDPEEGAHLPPLRLRPVAARSAPIPVASPSRGRDVHQPRTSGPHGHDPLGHPPPGCRRGAHAADGGRGGPPAPRFPQDRGRGRIRRSLR